jgi:endonuclease/exonuclease/phosphatase family metal-dependent hydrolase
MSHEQTPTVVELELVSDALNHQILNFPRNARSHRALMTNIPAMNTLEKGGIARTAQLVGDVSTVAWNLERCLFPKESAAHLADIAPQVVLLSEMDSGMARTRQRNTTKEMAAELGMEYAYGVEFHELDLGGETERGFCEDDFNARGWHGNAILSAAPMLRVKLMRLDDHGHWFAPDENAGDPGQPRVGGRMAVAAVIEHKNGPICFVSTHLESNADAAHRCGQFERLLAEIETFAPDMPVVIGGDLNTGNHIPDSDWRAETLFEMARGHGYDWHANAEGMTTRPSLITPHPDRVMKLDWFCCRGLVADQFGILPSIDPQGRPLSDHEAVFARFKA